MYIIETKESIARHYSACMDSVNLLNAGKPPYMTDDQWEEVKTANIEHLKIMLAKDFWTTQDLTPIADAITQVNVPPSSIR